MKIRNFVSSGVLALSLFAVHIANAQPARPAGLPTTVTQITSFIANRVVGFLSMIFWSLTGVFLIWAAYLYLFGSSEEDKIAQAKQILIYAVIAGIVAFFSTVGLPSIVESLF